MGNKKDKPLCKLAKKGVSGKALERYARLVGSPNFICTRCGRAAVSDKNLCKPQQIDPAV
jgi:hypothetical protein